MTNGCDISSEIALTWTSLDLSDDKSTLVQVMAWCRQATSHYLNQCWPRSLPPYGVTRAQWVKEAIWQHRSGSMLVQLTHWGRDKMAAVSQTMFSNAFSCMKMYEFRIKFHWSLFLWFQLTIYQHWFRYWLGAIQATSHYLNQWWLIDWRIYASLGLNELMACCLRASSLQRCSVAFTW